MRFGQAHKLSTYGVVLSAFFAVAFSGLLSPVIVALAFLGIVGSWRWEPSRARLEQLSIAWTLGALLIFIYEGISVVAGSEILLAGAEFLVALLLVKLFNRRESKDFLHIYLLSFLLLTAGTVLNAEVTYGFFFLCYVVTFTWAMIIFHLRRELEHNFLLHHEDPENSAAQARVRRVMNSRRIVGRKFFVGTSLVSLVVFGSAISMFLLFPRIGFGLFFDKGRGGITMAGFSDGVELGGHGLIKSDTTVVMRVVVEGKFRGRSAPSLHWRGVAFDHYSKGQWGRSRKAPETRHRVTLRGRTTRHHLLYDEPGQREMELEARLQGSIKQEIYLEPVGYNVLFAASMPLAYEFKNKINRTPWPGQNDELREAHTAGIKYTVYSNPEAPPAETLRAARTVLPAGYEVYLQLPPEIPKCLEESPRPTGNWSTGEVPPQCRVRQLARWITHDARNNYDRAKALETWLRSRMEYTLQMESPGEMEPVEFFLFQRQKGHCEYFSSAMAVMARSLGIPTRNVNGFLGGEWNEYDNYIAIRAGDAHSWVEVYFPEHGWVTFDPTPAGESDMLGRGNGGILDRMRRIADTVRFKWFKWVVEYDIYKQLELFRNLGKALRSGANDYFRNPLRGVGQWAKRNKKAAGFAFLLFGLLVAALSYWRQRTTRDLQLAPRAAKRKRGPIAKHYLSSLRSLSRRGYRRAESTTPREFARSLKDLGVPGAETMAELTELYYRSEYSRDALASAPDIASLSEKLSSQVRDALRDGKSRRKGGNPL